MNIDLPDNIINEIKEHASKEYPRESCGLVIIFKGKYKYIACKNLATQGNNFLLDPEDYAKAEDMGSIVKVVHSHPNLPPTPSQADLVGCEASGIPWIIVNWPVGSIYEFKPTNYKAPLIGREFSHGVLDCYTLIRDYYIEKLNIDLGYFFREEKWWDKGKNLYLDNAESSNFVVVPEPKLHDILLMQIGSAVPNHAAIWLGDGTILHHQTGRLSSIDVYGGWYRKVTTHRFRHRSLL